MFNIEQHEINKRSEILIGTFDIFKNSRKRILKLYLVKNSILMSESLLLLPHPDFQDLVNNNRL